ncbi:hypothetical protein M378DRAFT_57248, partial [Amanita muscaria Koide BX008]
QLRKVAYAIKNSSTKLLPRWREICKENQMKVRVMPRDVTTRWNSTFEMLDFAIEYKRALDQITGERDCKLRDYELLRREWAIASELRDIFKDATLFFSREIAPNLAMVIPAMDHIDEVFETNMTTSKYSPAITAALRIGKYTLNRYYTKTDYSETYRIAMGKYSYIDLCIILMHLFPVLHPRHKLVYFR